MKAFVFIDGNNFYNKLKGICFDNGPKKYALSDFDYQSFGKSLVGSHNLVGIRYYVGALKRQGDEKSEKMYADQQRFMAKLQTLGIQTVLGQIIRHPDMTFHEKGVDVRIAVEMIGLAREDQYDVAYLISSDTDLVPAAEEVISFGKQFHYVGFPKGQSFGLSKVANDVTLLRFEQIEPFLPTALI